MIDCIIHGDQISDLAALHDAFKRGLGFPDWYGGNLDALYDCLTDLPEARLTIYRWDVLAETLGEKAAILRRVITDAGIASPTLTVCILESDDEEI